MDNNYLVGYLPHIHFLEVNHIFPFFQERMASSTIQKMFLEEEDCNGHTPPDVALVDKGEKLVEMLVAHATGDYDLLMRPLDSLTVHEFIQLLRAGLYHRNLLIFVIDNSIFESVYLKTLVDIIKLAEDAGVDINAKSFCTKNALEHAMEKYNTKMVVALLEYGADVTACFPMILNSTHFTEIPRILYTTVLLQYCPSLAKLNLITDDCHFLVLDALIDIADPDRNKNSCSYIPSLIDSECLGLASMDYVKRLIVERSPLILFGKDPCCHLDEFVKVSGMTCPSSWLRSYGGHLEDHERIWEVLTELRRPKVFPLQTLANKVVRANVRIPLVRNVATLPVNKVIQEIIVMKRDVTVAMDEEFNQLFTKALGSIRM